ncbi:MAG: hypothetical protein ABIN94_08315 [Ferruginibacter sp.]
MTKTFLPHLLTRPEAYIVNVSSIGGFLALPDKLFMAHPKQQ